MAKDIRGGKFESDPKFTQPFGVDNAGDTTVQLVKDVARLQANMDHVMPLVTKVDAVSHNVASIKATLESVSINVKEFQKKFDDFKSNIDRSNKEDRALRYAKFSCIGTVGLLIFSALTFFAYFKGWIGS